VVALTRQLIAGESQAAVHFFQHECLCWIVHPVTAEGISLLYTYSKHNATQKGHIQQELEQVHKHPTQSSICKSLLCIGHMWTAQPAIPHGYPEDYGRVLIAGSY